MTAAKLQKQYDLESGASGYALLTGNNVSEERWRERARAVAAEPDVLIRVWMVFHAYGALTDLTYTAWASVEPDRDGFILPPSADLATVAHCAQAFAFATRCERGAEDYEWSLRLTALAVYHGRISQIEATVRARYREDR